MCPYIPDDQNTEEEKPKAPLSKEERLMNFIIQEATEQDIIDNLKAGFQRFGIEGTEEVFKKVYANYPILQKKYQEAFNKLLGRC